MIAFVVEIPTFTIVILALGCLFSVASGVVCVVVKVNGIWSWRKTSIERDEDKGVWLGKV